MVGRDQFRFLSVPRPLVIVYFLAAGVVLALALLTVVQ
jgi:hypothetical protein